MRFMIDEELTNTFGDDIDAEVAKLNELLKKSGSSATIERYPYGTALCIKESLTNTRGAGRKEIKYSAIKISFLKERISEIGAENTAKELGMTKAGMYKRIRKRTAEGSEYF